MLRRDALKERNRAIPRRSDERRDARRLSPLFTRDATAFRERCWRDVASAEAKRASEVMRWRRYAARARLPSAMSC